MTRLKHINVDREAAKISASSCGELEKYKYLTGEDLALYQDLLKKTSCVYCSCSNFY